MSNASMEESLLIKDWRRVYLYLSETVPPLKQPVMDTIVLDSLEEYKPVAWVHTGEDGNVSTLNIHTSIFQDILENLLKLSSRQVPTYQFLARPKTMEPLVMVTVGQKRVVLTSKTLPNLQVLYPTGVEGITLMKYIGKRFDPRVFIYEREDENSSYDDSVRIRPRDTLEKDPNCVPTTQHCTQRQRSYPRSEPAACASSGSCWQRRSTASGSCQ